MANKEWDEADVVVRKQLRPFGWSEIVSIQEEMAKYMEEEGVAENQLAVYRPVTPNDRVDENLREDLSLVTTW